MKPRTLADLDAMVHADELRLSPSFRADGSVVWRLIAYDYDRYGGCWSGWLVEMGRAHGSHTR